MVVHTFRGKAIMPVSLHLILEGADHLAMTEIAAFALIDVASGKFQRRIGRIPSTFSIVDLR